MKTSVFSFMLILFLPGLSHAQTIPADSLYLGQTPPGNTPQVFAPGIISKPGRAEYGISISQAGDEMLFALGNWPNKRTMIMKYVNNHWTGPDTASFSTTRSAEEAIYSPDGTRVYYYAYNPPNPVGGADLCYSVKNGTVWSEPINISIPLNTAQDEYHPCIVSDSSVYFENVAGKICYSKYQNGSYQPRVLMPALFNDPGNAWGNPYVSPDEGYFIFNSSRPGGFGGTDLYISYKKPDGTWTNPKNLGNVINTSTNECGSEITDDSLFMTYVSNNDIYWVGSGFIDNLMYTNFIPYVLNLIPEQTATLGEPFLFTIPDSTFMDDDGNHTLTYGAKQSNGEPLPSWLHFDTITATFSGTPSLIEYISVIITATDTAGASDSTHLKIMVVPHVSIDPADPESGHISIFPNPSTGFINVRLNSGPDKIVVAEVHSPDGKVIRTARFKQGTEMDLSDAGKGICILKVIFDHEIIVRKIWLY